REGRRAARPGGLAQPAGRPAPEPHRDRLAAERLLRSLRERRRLAATALVLDRERRAALGPRDPAPHPRRGARGARRALHRLVPRRLLALARDRKSTRLNSSH